MAQLNPRCSDVRRAQAKTTESVSVGIMPNPVEVRFLSLNVSLEVGANDGLVAVRVVPAGRDGTKVYGRARLILVSQ